jgi:hypothetical protein
MSTNVTFLRPAAVECHVRRVAKRMGADQDLTKKAVQRAALAIRAGDSAHRAIVAGVEVAAATLALERRKAVQPSAASPSPLRCAVILVATLVALALIGFLTKGV